MEGHAPQIKTEDIVGSPDNREIRITGCGREMKEAIANAAAYYGVTQAAFLKMQLRLQLDALPDHIRRFKPLD